jgi:hypothetical protein
MPGAVAKHLRPEAKVAGDSSACSFPARLLRIGADFRFSCDLLQANPSWAMLVAGHTDNVRAKDMNLTLSRQRAEAVITWRSTEGVDRTRLVPAGFRDMHPVADNKDEDGRQKNGRVDLIKLY